MRPFFIATAFVFFLGCNEPEGSRYNKIARAYCECAGKLVEMNKKAEALASNPDAGAAFQENLRLIQEEYEKTRTCATIIISQFGKLKAAELDSVKIALATEECLALSKEGDLLQEMLGE